RTEWWIVDWELLTMENLVRMDVGNGELGCWNEEVMFLGNFKGMVLEFWKVRSWCDGGCVEDIRWKELSKRKVMHM
ncbi:hypothetical protein, partial [Bacillus sp. WP8]|uniref:hypothetical protein n=1 Tax=Bacillus sp. WP8 TaxID=756828 RepID=UPI001C92DCDA